MLGTVRLKSVVVAPALGVNSMNRWFMLKACVTDDKRTRVTRPRRLPDTNVLACGLLMVNGTP